VINDQLEKSYIKYYRELYLYAFSLCKNHHLAQDLTSDTFFKAYLSLDDDVEYFKYWIFRVCKNLYFDFLRKEKEYSSENKLENIIFNNETPLDKIIESEEKKRLYSLVINLRESYREILILYYYCGFSIEEISKSRDITESAAKTLLFRARKKLKNALEGEMNYRELLHRYKNGIVTEEEKQLVEQEIEKHEALEEYLSEVMDEEFDDMTIISNVEKHDEETTKLKRSVNNRLRKVVFTSVAIVITIFISIFFVVSPLIDALYYNPNKTTVGKRDNDISFDVYAISELNMPGYSPSTVLAHKKGFGEYNVMYSNRNVFNDELYSVNHSIKRSKIISTNRDPILNTNVLQSVINPVINESIMEENKKDVLNHLKELNPVSYVSVGIIFENDLSMKDLYNLELKYPDIEFQWAGIRTNTLDQKVNELIGIHLKNSKMGSGLLGDEQIRKKYPAFFVMDWLVNPVGKKDVDYSIEAQAYEHHYMSLLEYVVDRKDAVNVLEYRKGKDEFYQSALEYAKEHGVKTYGALVFAEVKDLIEMADNKSIKGLDFNQALVSRRNIH